MIEDPAGELPPTNSVGIPFHSESPPPGPRVHSKAKRGSPRRVVGQTFNRLNRGSGLQIFKYLEGPLSRAAIWDTQLVMSPFGERAEPLPIRVIVLILTSGL